MNSKTNRFSIIIPTMWKSEYIHKMLPIYEDSQLISEIIIIDNDYIKCPSLTNYKKIKYYTEYKNIYVNPAWNVGYKLANNEIILINDDIFIPNIDDVLELISSSDFDFVGLDWENNKNLQITPITEFERNGFGCFIYVKNYLQIPNEYKIFRGDYLLFENNEKRGKLSNPQLIGEIGKTRKSNLELIEVSKNDLNIYKKKNMKIAVSVHLYHIDMLEQIRSYLNNLTSDYDLFVTLVKNYPKSFLDNIKRTTKNVTIIFVENKGMDIGGFLNSLKYIDESYDLVLKIHTKKAIGSDNTPSRHRKTHGYESAIKYGQNWFNDLMNGVLGNKEKVDRILSEFTNNNNCGMIGNRITQNFRVNVNEMDKIFKIIRLDNNYKESSFIGGTIFWVRNSILKKYLSNDIIDDILENLPIGYVSEPSPNHAMERIFGCLVYTENKNILRII